MALVALDNASITNSIASGHISYECWEVVGQECDTDCDSEGNCDTDCWDVYGWVGYTTSATVSGTCIASTSTVYINGKNAVLNGNSTKENDSYSVPCTYRSGAHTGATGSVTSGNVRSVFIGSTSVSTIGSTITTHASTSATINGGGSTNVYIGG